MARPATIGTLALSSMRRLNPGIPTTGPVPMLLTFLTAFLSTQLLAIAMLWLGERLLEHPWLRTLGRIAHKRKMDSLRRFWPLTLIPPAVAKGDVAICTTVLASLIIIKSLACAVLGVIVVFWLPFACLIVPSIVAEHEPGNRELNAWVRQVSLWQVTSHVLAAAIGCAIVIESYRTGVAIRTTVISQFWLVAPVTLFSLGTGWVAGHLEATGLVRRGI